MADDDTTDGTPEESEGKKPERAEGDKGGPAGGETAARAEDTEGKEAEGAEGETPEDAADEKDQQAEDTEGDTPEDTEGDTPEGAGDETSGDAGDAGEADSEPVRGINKILIINKLIINKLIINKKLVIAGAAALFLVGGGVALVFTGALDSLIGGGQKRAIVELPGPPVQYEFPALLVDLKTGRCRSPFIKLRAVALVSEPDMDRLAEVETQVMDAFQVFLRDHERQDLVGRAGTDKLRQGFLSIINTAMEPAQARNVLFREILLQ
jgi:flagellar basal body-associated protein FliL